MEIELKDRIIARTTLLFVKYGIKSITMDRVAHEIGISKRTLYGLFADKDELLEHCLEYNFEKSRKEAEILTQGCTNAIEIMMVVFKDTVEKLSKTNRNYLSDIKRYHPMVASKHEEKTKFNRQNILVLINQGKLEGLFHANLNVEILAVLLEAQVELMVKSDEYDIDTYPLAQIFETIILTFVRGISTPKGLAVVDEFATNHFQQIHIN